jgi:hypothetical protein
MIATPQGSSRRRIRASTTADALEAGRRQARWCRTSLGKGRVELTDDVNAEAGWDQALERLAEYLAKEEAP